MTYIKAGEERPWIKTELNDPARRTPDSPTWTPVWKHSDWCEDPKCGGAGKSIQQST
jgi:hypothetical protein